MSAAITGLELRHLRALQAIARAGSFHGAAARLGYTQSAISQQIAGLERVVDQRLVERSGGRQRVALTEAGHGLLLHAEAVFARLDTAMRELRAVGNGTAGSVRVGYFQSIGRHLVPGLIKRVSQRSEMLELHLSERDCDLELQRQVACGELDLAFVVLPAVEEHLATLELIADRPVAIMRADDHTGSTEGMLATQLAARNLATFPLSPYQALLEAAVADAGQRPRIVVRSQDNDALLAIADDGDAVALMTALSARGLTNPALRVVPLLGAPRRRIGVAWDARASQSSATAAVLEEAVATSAEFGEASTDGVRPRTNQFGLSTMPILT